MKSRIILISLAVITVALITYLGLTSDQRSAKRVHEEAVLDSLRLVWRARDDSIQEVRLSMEQKALEKAFLDEISGVYQESVLGRKITLDLRGNNKIYQDGAFGYKLTVKEVDLKNETVCFYSLYGEDKVAYEMYITRVVSVAKSPLTVDTEIFTNPWELYWIRGLN